MDDDCLYCILCGLCRHERGRVAAVSSQWCRVGSMCTTACTYAHEVVHTKSHSCHCLVHDEPHGAEFLSAFERLRREIHSERRFGTFGTSGTYVHFRTTLMQKQFLQFLKYRLGVFYVLGGTCCGGKGIKFQLIRTGAHAEHLHLLNSVGVLPL